jgi:hypothetical protein
VRVSCNNGAKAEAPETRTTSGASATSSAAYAAAAWPLAARAQQSGQVRMAESDTRVQTRIAAFKARAS